MMGAGKTSLGREIAEMSGRDHVDIDHMLQQRLGRPIPQLFKLYGESAFRDHEASVLRSLQPSNSIVSTGGGIVMREANWVEMGRLGVTVFVEVGYDFLVERLEMSKKRRPLLDFEDWKDRLRKLLDERQPMYERADLTVDVSGMDVQDAANAVYKGLTCRP